MKVKCKTFSTLSKFQIKSITVEATEEKLQALRSLQKDSIRFYGEFDSKCLPKFAQEDNAERDHPVRIQPIRRKTHHENDVPTPNEQSSFETQTRDDASFDKSS